MRRLAVTPNHISQPGQAFEPAHRARGDAGIYPAILPVTLVVLGLVARFYPARSLFLNPDEALIYFLSAQPTLAATYRASLISAHPPLLYLLLHCFRLLGQSELVMRMPSVVAGAAFCWMGYQWLRKITDAAAALVGLMFFCFTPALIGLGAELRQYSILLFFFAACLYLLESGIQENSPWRVGLFSLSLWLAILTQYSAWLFCLATCIYALLRFAQHRPAGRVLITWASGQALGVAIYGFLYRTQVPWLLKMAQVDKVFQGEQSRLSAIPRESFRLFHYLFSQPVVGSVVLLLYVAGVVALWRQPAAEDSGKPSGRHLACLLVLPFALSWAAALGHLYPYDGTRHSIVLAVFVIAGASVGLSRMPRLNAWTKPLVVAVLLIACRLASAPLGPYMKPRDQKRQFMQAAVSYVRHSAPSGAVVLVDDQTTYLFRYYFCGAEGAVQSLFGNYHCGGYSVIGSRQWMFTPEQLPADLQRPTRVYGLRPGDPVWMFQVGWNVNKEPDLRAKLKDFGCTAPQNFGENILVCELREP